MLWLFRKILDRLLARSVLQVASELEAEIQLELTDVRAELLRKADDFEREQIVGFEELAAGLRARAAKMADENETPGSDVLAVVALLRQEDLREPLQTNSAKGSPAGDSHRSLLPAITRGDGKNRGRPRKDEVVGSARKGGELSVIE
jgi:hypothetical protein